MPVILGLFGKAFLSFGLKLITSLASEKFIEWAFFNVAESVVKSTNNTTDDEWLDKIKKSYYESIK